ncbi:MAG: YciI family protein [Proteobacteria bacterium]|nr:YciI family protein [Cystobacterineae bacterium]MCL2258475.1 YciI family protein [Cystobacterineae bacterium]MCL2315185.1 YciI family protein [Pseudomonadota bacterium]
MYFAIYVLDKPQKLARRIALRDIHRQRLRQLQQENRLMLAGPLCQENGEPIGSLVVAEFESLEAAKAWAAKDPYMLEGVYGQPDIRPFSKAFPC